MRLILEILTGPRTGQKIVAQAGQVVRVGRTSNAAVALDDTFMSSQHFAIECVGGACGIRDLASRNGTKLNGERVTLAVLHHGDRVHAGQTDFLVHIEVDEEVPASQFDQQQPTLLPTLPPTPRDEVAGAFKQPRPATVNTDPEPESHQEKDSGMGAYEAATPEGALLSLLQRQPGYLMALVDATHDKRVLELLQQSGEEYRSLYRAEQNAALAPHLVQLSSRANLLKQLIGAGWGKSWGIYLTSNVTLAELREYFRRSLMVRLPDGVEMFSRFYDPRFFRSFLESCSAEEAQRYFGPIRSYLMESDRPEIVLEFTYGAKGVEKKGHLLSILE